MNINDEVKHVRKKLKPVLEEFNTLIKDELYEIFAIPHEDFEELFDIYTKHRFIIMKHQTPLHFLQGISEPEPEEGDEPDSEESNTFIYTFVKFLFSKPEMYLDEDYGFENSEIKLINKFRKFIKRETDVQGYIDGIEEHISGFSDVITKDMISFKTIKKSS